VRRDTFKIPGLILIGTTFAFFAAILVSDDFILIAIRKFSLSIRPGSEKKKGDNGVDFHCESFSFCFMRSESCTCMMLEDHARARGLGSVAFLVGKWTRYDEL